VVVRTPMGGRRGYGPTHSQTLDKFLVGIDNIKTVAINTFFDPGIIYKSILNEKHPVIVIENKTDYGKKILHYQAPNFVYEINEDSFPVARARPVKSAPDITIVAYGGMAELVNTILGNIFAETDFKPELIVPSLISHLPADIIAQAAERTKRLLVIEEGSAYAGIGAELIAQVTERCSFKIETGRIAAMPVPIPSVKSLEQIVLPDKERIIQEIKTKFK
jgi:2-oxoisovalerate dehydrogenase E1 component